MGSVHIRTVESSHASERLARAADFVSAFAPSTEVLLLGATREAIDDFARAIASRTGATFGLHRFTLTQLAARLAQAEIAVRGLAHASTLAAEAVAARVAFEAVQTGTIAYLRPVALYPGFTRALASTLGELRLAGVQGDQLAALNGSGPDLARLLAAYAQRLADAAITDRFDLLRIATQAVPTFGPPVGTPLLLLDVPVESRAECDLLAALVAQSPAVFATVPAGDDRMRAALQRIGPCEPVTLDPTRSPSSLARLSEYLFGHEPPPEATADDTVSLFSAPGEGRECIEIARRILDEARRGVRFDDMAILLRAPDVYSGLLENALRRAAVPAFFARGTRRPDPSGRAFLALLTCRAEGLSAKRFAEYLSLGQVPGLSSTGAPPTDRAVWSAPDDEALGPAADATRLGTASPPAAAGAEAAADADDVPVIEGTLRAPWKWEELVVEAAVIGGRDRWVRRLNGLASELRIQLQEAEAEEPDSPRVFAIRRDRQNLEHLQRFALPVIDALDAFPSAATWGDWLAALQHLAPMVLRHPERVLSVLAELQPMSAVGPVSLDEVRDVLLDRLATVEQDSPAQRYGRVFVATPDQARGRSFEVVFVPGLAERIFPQRPREDPLLLDELRLALGPDLLRQADRGARERTLLRLAIGSARTRVYLSYPRFEVVEGRARVPSFYGLDVERAITGRIPNVDQFERESAKEADARLAWPAPKDPRNAIDDFEHDLAVLGALLQETRPSRFKGRARYLLELNEHLARSLRGRWARWESTAWTSADGLVGITEDTAALLAAQRLTARPYSVSALQEFARCPYRFLLGAIHRLEPRQEAVALEQLDPLTRGRIFHSVQAALLRELQRSGSLPVKPSNLDSALARLDEVVDRVSATYREELAPAIPRIWQDEINAMRADLRVWLRRVAEVSDRWEPAYFELGFGLPPDEQRDPTSVPDPVTLPGGYRLRGAIDLVERQRGGAALRVTDHKTGAARTRAGVIVGGGSVLQPVLYGLAIEAALGMTVTEGRLFYCTSAGGFAEHVVPLNDTARHHAAAVLEAIDHAVERGFLPAAPEKEACAWCSFREVCGPYEELRTARKPRAKLDDVTRLRGLP